MTLTTQIKSLVTALQIGDQDFGGPDFTPVVTSTIKTTNGTAEGQADLIFVDERVVGDGANDDIDLAGVLTGAFGSTHTFVTIVSIMVINGAIDGSLNTTDLTIGNAANPFFGFLGSGTDTVGPLKPGAVFQMASSHADGLGAVTPGSADLLRIANSAGASATYQICIIGRSA